MIKSTVFAGILFSLFLRLTRACRTIFIVRTSVGHTFTEREQSLPSSGYALHTAIKLGKITQWSLLYAWLRLRWVELNAVQLVTTVCVGGCLIIYICHCLQDDCSFTRGSASVHCLRIRYCEGGEEFEKSSSAISFLYLKDMATENKVHSDSTVGAALASSSDHPSAQALGCEDEVESTAVIDALKVVCCCKFVY